MDQNAKVVRSPKAWQTFLEPSYILLSLLTVAARFWSGAGSSKHKASRSATQL